MTANRQPIEAPARERGQTIFVVALAMVALLAFVGLATDAALVYLENGRLQRAVDASALAAANKLPDTAEAELAAYEFARLNGYGFEPVNDPLGIAFPVTDPPRKIAVVTGTVDVDLAFLRVIGWNTAAVTAHGTGESAPLDVYLVLDLSHSMVYDTPRPSWWNNNSQRYYVCPQTGCPNSYCRDSDSDSWTLCRAYYCSYEGTLRYRSGATVTKARNCDPLDEHIKDSAKYFVDQLDPRYDRIGVIGYDVEGTRAITLTSDFDAVRSAIDNLDPYFDSTYAPGGSEHLCTNVGDGLMYANHYLALPSPEDGGEGARLDSIWSIVLLTDGRANRYRDCAGCPPDCEAMPACRSRYCSPWTGVCARANQWAVDNAWVSWNDYKIVAYTVAYGDIFFDEPQYRQLMIRIADIADNGAVDGATENFWAVPDEAGLRQALEEIAERIYTRLLE
jgi:Flp pilus assembly protein TadG